MIGILAAIVYLFFFLYRKVDTIVAFAVVFAVFGLAVVALTALAILYCVKYDVNKHHQRVVPMDAITPSPFIDHDDDDDDEDDDEDDEGEEEDGEDADEGAPEDGTATGTGAEDGDVADDDSFSSFHSQDHDRNSKSSPPKVSPKPSVPQRKIEKVTKEQESDYDGEEEHEPTDQYHDENDHYEDAEQEHYEEEHYQEEYYDDEYHEHYHEEEHHHHFDENTVYNEEAPDLVDNVVFDVKHYIVNSMLQLMKSGIFISVDQILHPHLGADGMPDGLEFGDLEQGRVLSRHKNDMRLEDVDDEDDQYHNRDVEAGDDEDEVDGVLQQRKSIGNLPVIDEDPDESTESVPNVGKTLPSSKADKEDSAQEGTRRVESATISRTDAVAHASRSYVTQFFQATTASVAKEIKRAIR